MADCRGRSTSTLGRKQMQMKLCALLTLVLILSACAAPSATAPSAHTSPVASPSTGRPSPAVATAPLIYTPEVRRLSYADDRLFRDMVTGIAGVDFYDRVSFPKSTHRSLVGIEVVTPYDSRQTGVERWSIQHDGDVTATYIVRFMPDGRGGTNFAVARDKGQP